MNSSAVFNLNYLNDDDEYDEKLNLDDLYQAKLEKEKAKLETYKKILARVHKKIKVTSRQYVDDQYCCFIVPEFILGVAHYDHLACIDYIMMELTKNNFLVKFIHPNTLFISWKHWIPNYVRDQFKKQTGITIDGNGCVLNKNENAGENAGMKMLSYESMQTHDTNEKQFKDVNDYKESGKLLYSDNLLEKLQSIVSKTREAKK